METKDMVIVGLVVLLVLVVAFSASNIGTTGKAIDISCSDSDGGYNIYEKGQISGTDSIGTKYGLGTDRPMTDYCMPTPEGVMSTVVKEYKCNVGQGDPGWQSKVVDCSAFNPGSKCIDGACTQ